MTGGIQYEGSNILVQKLGNIMIYYSSESLRTAVLGVTALVFRILVVQT